VNLFCCLAYYSYFHGIVIPCEHSRRGITLSILLVHTCIHNAAKQRTLRQQIATKVKRDCTVIFFNNFLAWFSCSPKHRQWIGYTYIHNTSENSLHQRNCTLEKHHNSQRSLSGKNHNWQQKVFDRRWQTPSTLHQVVTSSKSPLPSDYSQTHLTGQHWSLIMSTLLGTVPTYPCFILYIVSKWEDQTNDIHLTRLSTYGGLSTVMKNSHRK